MNFREYEGKRERIEIKELMEEHGIRLTEEQINVLLEAGWMSNAKKGLGKAAIMATLPFAMSANWANHQPKPYHFQGEKFSVNQQHLDDEAADKAYVDAGGPNFKDRESEEFARFQSTPQHAEILKRAGLPRDYIPTSVRQFAYGTRISTAEESYEESAVIKDAIQRRFGRDSFVSIVRSQDAKTGGAVLLARVSGTVVAMNEQDAIQKAQTIISEIVKDKGFDIQGFKDLDRDVEVKQASRSTIDYAAEAAGTPIRFKVEFKLVKRR